MDMADDLAEDYPLEIDEQLKTFQTSVASVNTMVQTALSMPRQELMQKLDPLEQAKLDLMSAYTLNSLFWMYLVTQGVNPKEHGIKQELERIRTYMNRVKEITDRKKAARLDKGAVSRFVRNALWDSEEAASKKGEAASKKEGKRPEKEEGSKRRKHTPGRGQHSKRSKMD